MYIEMQNKEDKRGERKIIEKIEYVNRQWDTERENERKWIVKGQWCSPCE